MHGQVGWLRFQRTKYPLSPAALFALSVSWFAYPFYLLSGVIRLKAGSPNPCLFLYNPAMSSRNEALETIKQLIPTLTVADLSRVVLKLIRDQVGADRGTLFVVDHTRGEVRSIVADRVIGQISLPIGFGIAGSVAETGQVIDTYNPLYDE